MIGPSRMFDPAITASQVSILSAELNSAPWRNEPELNFKSSNGYTEFCKVERILCFRWMKIQPRRWQEFVIDTYTCSWREVEDLSDYRSPQPHGVDALYCYQQHTAGKRQTRAAFPSCHLINDSGTSQRYWNTVIRGRHRNDLHQC